MPAHRQLAGNRGLQRLLAAFGLLNVAEWGFVTALSIYAFRVGGTLDVGLIGLRLLAGAVSSAMLAPLFVSRRNVLSVVTSLRVVLLAGAAVLAIHGGVFALVLVIVVVDSLVAAVYRPAQSRLMPSLARSPQELTRAVAGSSMAKTVGQAAGAMIGGGAVEFVSPGTAMAGEAGVMTVAFLIGLRLAGRVRGGAGGSAATPRDGLAAFPRVLSHPNAWPLVSASVLRTMVRGLWNALLVVVALRLLREGSSSVGLLQAASGVGVMIAVPVTATQIGRSRLALPCAAAFVCAGTAIGVVSADPGLAVVAALSCLWGLSTAVADATSLSLLHRLLPAREFSGTVGVMESLKLLSEGSGALLAPACVAVFGLRVSLLIAGATLPLLVIGTWVRMRGADEIAAGRGALVSLLHDVKLLSELDMASVEGLAAHAEAVSVAAGVDAITQGEPGDRFYVIQDGSADILIDGHTVRQIGPGDEFGERALLRDTPRTATVRATVELQLLAIDRDDFLEVVTGEQGVHVQAPDLRGVRPYELLAQQPAFEGCDVNALKLLSLEGESRELPAGTAVFDMGDPADAAYLILNGRVELYRQGALSSVLEGGELFGELSVLHGTGRTARVVCSEATTVLVLPAEAVLRAVRSAPGEPGSRVASGLH